LPDEAKTQVDQALQQLRLAQVQAENQRTGKDQPEPNDLDRAPTGIAPSSTASGAKSTAGGGAPAATTSAQPRASQLWRPGQRLSRSPRRAARDCPGPAPFPPLWRVAATHGGEACANSPKVGSLGGPDDAAAPPAPPARPGGPRTRRTRAPSV